MNLSTMHGLVAKYLIQIVPHYGLDLLSLAQFFCDHVNRYAQIDIDHAAGGNLRVLSTEEAWETIEDCAQCDKQWKNPTSTIPDKIITNLNTQLVENEVVRVKVPKCMAWLDDEPIRDLNTIEDKVDNRSPQSTLQVLPSFEEYTPPVTYPKEVEETLGTLIEVEPLDETQLEDLGFNTCNHDIPLSSREDPSFDKPEPQPQPLPNCPPLDASLITERGFKPPIKPQSPDSFRMKVLDNLTIHIPHSCLLGHSGSSGVDFSKLGMIEDDWELESKEVSFLGRGLNSPVRPKEVEKVIFDEKKLGSS
ncbi:hypothetical protein Tco_0705336 [Tanacetum coccineum]|uniref:Uncharacterized protein n=1 Tax=Tanacetum coccineum TaxID=301880 RepID=A0ABQ4Y4B6_9ASTR